MDRAERRRQQRLAAKGADGQPRTRSIAPAESMALAETYRRQGRLAEAYTLYQRVLLAYPQHAQTLDRCGLVALQFGKTEEAIRHLRRAVASKHDFAAAHNHLAIAFGAAGRLEEALSSCRRAIRFQPELVESHVNLGHLLKRNGEFEEATKAYQQAITLRPEHGNAHYQLGLTWHALERLDHAAASLRQAATLRPDHAEVHYSLGLVLHGMKDLDAALGAYDRAIRLKPEMLDSLFDVGKPRHVLALFERGEHRKALDSLDTFLRRSPGQSCALALKAIALDETGARDQVRALVDFERLIHAQRLDPPADFDSIEALNQALGRHILAHPSLGDAPEAFSAHRGKATGELLRGDKGPFRVFERMIRAAVEAYRRDLPDLPDHPFVANAPHHWNLTMWGNVIETEGFQVPHIHPSGWLSGVYYATLPDVIGARADERAGWIEFGEPYWDIAHEVQPELETYRPEAGMLLLFPSYFYHRTLPFVSDQQRISIAFDVVPSR
ncbi:MAG: tetratricopeptide repeat protein [Pseudomonadota bacterium]